MDARLAVILKTAADAVDQIAAPDKFAARNAIHEAVYDPDYLCTYLAIWECDGPDAARTYDRDLMGLHSAAIRAAFPDGDSMRFVSGDGLRAAASQL